MNLQFSCNEMHFDLSEKLNILLVFRKELNYWDINQSNGKYSSRSIENLSSDPIITYNGDFKFFFSKLLRPKFGLQTP